MEEEGYKGKDDFKYWIELCLELNKKQKLQRKEKSNRKTSEEKPVANLRRV